MSKRCERRTKAPYKYYNTSVRGRGGAGAGERKEGGGEEERRESERKRGGKSDRKRG